MVLGRRAWILIVVLCAALPAGSAPAAPVVAVDSAGRIVVGGGPQVGGAYLARLDARGAPDRSFGVDGVVVDHQAPGFNAVLPQADGSILAAGYSTVSRYRPDGSLDLSFGDGGRAELGASIHRPVDMLTMPDGTIVLAGSVQYKMFPDEAVVVGLSPDGRKREWIAGLGLRTSARGLALRADGTLLVAGTGAEATREQAFLARVDPALVPPFEGFWSSISATSNPPGFDPSFGGGAGIVYFSFPGQASGPYGGTRLGALASSGDAALLAGLPAGRPALAKFGPEGKLDQGFGAGGFAALDLGRSKRAELEAAMPAADGDILVLGTDRGAVPPAGSRRPEAPSWPFVARFQADGSVDSGFGAGGVARPPLAGRHGVRGEALVLLPAGELLLGGEFRDDWSVLALARLRADGSVDRGFGDGGTLWVNPCEGSEALLRRRGCIGRARGEVSLRGSGRRGLGLHLKVEPTVEWAGLSELRVELPPSLALREGGLKRARFTYYDASGRKRTERAVFRGNRIRPRDAWNGVSPVAYLDIPTGALRRVPGAAGGLRFKVRVSFTTRYAAAGGQTLSLRP